MPPSKLCAGGRCPHRSNSDDPARRTVPVIGALVPSLFLLAPGRIETAAAGPQASVGTVTVTKPPLWGRGEVLVL